LHARRPIRSNQRRFCELGDPFLDSQRLRFCIRPFPQIVPRPRRARRRHRLQPLRLRLQLRQFRLRGGKLRHLVRGELSSLLLALELGHASLHRRGLFACGGRRLRRRLRLCRTRARCGLVAAAAAAAAAAKDVSKPHLVGTPRCGEHLHARQLIRFEAVPALRSHSRPSDHHTAVCSPRLHTCMQSGRQLGRQLGIIIRRCVVLVFIPDEGGHQIYIRSIHSAALSGNPSLMKEAIRSTQRYSYLYGWIYIQGVCMFTHAAARPDSGSSARAVQRMHARPTQSPV